MRGVCGGVIDLVIFVVMVVYNGVVWLFEMLVSFVV